GEGMKRNLLKKDGVQSLLASLVCVVLGLFLGYVVLLAINPAGAGEAILTVIKNFLTYNRPSSQLKYLGNTLVKTAPLLMCALSILFAYKVGLFNIGAAGQYCAGVALSLYAALAWGWGWLPCMLLAMLGGMVLGAISGLLKSYCNVNEVISGIMLNWIVLYLTNMLLTNVKEATSPYTFVLAHKNPSAILPSLGIGSLFNNNGYVGLALPLSVLAAVAVWVVLEKTRFGYELRATGNNKNAAKYCGMAEKRNIILTLVISGALAGLGAAMLYLTGYEQWQCSTSSVPGMGFNGIAAAFLGGLNPFGTILASFFIQHITAGGAYVDKSMYCAQISDLISSLIIYLCGFVLFIKYAMNVGIRKREEKATLKEKEQSETPPADANTGKGGDQ
ncbi:ABC transporter permease, partial [Vescimonas sp.]|uniref:ABC transporter permease n=1 Tax=Vescimonas sp. TaxID=2892404 RepID=UPI00307B4CED